MSESETPMHIFDLINTEIIEVEREMARVWARPACVLEENGTIKLRFSYRDDTGWKLMVQVGVEGEVVLTRAPRVIRIAAINMFAALETELDRIVSVEAAEKDALASVRETVSRLKSRPTRSK